MSESIANTHKTSSSLSNNSHLDYNVTAGNSLNKIADPRNNTVVASILVNSIPHLLEVLQQFIVLSTFYFYGGVNYMCLLAAIQPITHLSSKHPSDSIA